MTFLHVRVKFAPRWDTPGDHYYQNLKVDITAQHWGVEALSLAG